MANPNPSPGTRFGPGNPGGPGRPRSKPLTDRLRERLEAPTADGRTLADDLVDRWVQLMQGDDKQALQALREALLRVEGRPVEASGEGGVPSVLDALRAIEQVEAALDAAESSGE